VLKLCLAYFISLLSSCSVMFNTLDLGVLLRVNEEEKMIAGSPNTREKYLIIGIKGNIVSMENSGSGVVSPDNFIRLMYALTKKKNLKGIILNIDSPGGSAAASEEIFQQIYSFKKRTNLPVIAYVSGIAASGGYYLALAADRIYANQNAVIGSIGVISIFFSIEKLIKETFKAEVVTIKSGQLKDSGSIFRQMTEREKTYWNRLVQHYFNNFLRHVKQRRELSKSSLETIKDGRVFHPEEAQRIGLIDKILPFPKLLEEIQKGETSPVKFLQYQPASTSPSLFRLEQGGTHLSVSSILGFPLSSLPSIRGRILFYANQ